MNRLISPDPLRKDFLLHARWAGTLYGTVKPDPGVAEFTARVGTLTVIADAIRERTGEGPADISHVMANINAVLDDAIEADGFHVREGEQRTHIIDISKVDFDVLARRFARAKRKSIELEALRAAVRAQLDTVIRVNRTRANFLAKFGELIDAYNAGSRNIDDLFRDLLDLSRSLSVEQRRHVVEQLTEEELTVFDLLTRPGPELSPEERAEVKKAARHLLTRVGGALVLDWRHRAQSRAQVRIVIQDTLDEGLPRAFTPDICRAKSSALFEHVFETFTDSASA